MKAPDVLLIGGEERKLSSCCIALGRNMIRRFTIFQNHVVSFLWMWHRDHLELNQGRLLPYTSLSDMWKGSVDTLDVNKIVVQSCWFLAVGMVSSKSELVRKGKRCFLSVKFEGRMMIGYSRGTLIYMNIHGNIDLYMRNLELVLSMSLKEPNITLCHSEVM